jgi:hypothetical protein
MILGNRVGGIARGAADNCSCSARSEPPRSWHIRGRISNERHSVSAKARLKGRAFQDRRKQGCLREAPMDGFTAFLERPPLKPGLR